MKNHWLDKKKTVCGCTAGQFEQAVIEWQNEKTPDNTQELSRILIILTENIIKYFGKINWIDPEEVLQECVTFAFEKADRFDHKKGKAFNFFTTIILGHMRQLYRSQKPYPELKQKYEEFLAGKKKEK
jgi:hypothetical protein